MSHRAITKGQLGESVKEEPLLLHCVFNALLLSNHIQTPCAPGQLEEVLPSAAAPLAMKASGHSGDCRKESVSVLLVPSAAQLTSPDHFH